MNMEFPRFADTPEGVFLDECLAFIRAFEVRASILLAELDHIKKAIANEPQPEAGNSGK
jgi:hypothetical protein